MNGNINWRYIRRILIIGSLASTGLSSIGLAVMAPELSGELIVQTVTMLNAGLDVASLQATLNGLLAGGRIAVLPGWAVNALACWGVVSLYLAVFMVTNPQPKAIRQLFTTGYWMDFEWNPEALRRREAMRQRLELQRQDPSSRRPVRGDKKKAKTPTTLR